MIYLYTGANGSGKTANLLASLLTDKQFSDRDVYYFNVHGLEVEECSKRQGGIWREIDEEGVRSWQQLPQGSILLIDEAHKVFPSRQARIECPKYIVDLDEHRKEGLDLIFATQHPKKLDVELRRLVSQHVHLVRTSLNCTRYLIPQCIDDVQDPKARMGVECTKSKVQLPKFVFSLYKSAEVHTHKYEVPRKAKMAAVVAVLGIGAIFWASSSLSDRLAGEDLIENIDPVNNNPVSPPIPSFFPRASVDPSPSKVSTKPRDPERFMSAPIYDEVLQTATEVPIPHCVINNTANVCKCYSQQMTVMREISYAECVDIVNYGVFNPNPPSSNTAQGTSASVPRAELDNNKEYIPLEVYEDMYRQQYSSARWVSKGGQ